MLKNSFKLLLIISCLNITAACSHDKNDTNKSVESASANENELSVADSALIEEYNKITEHLVNGNEEEFRQKLKEFLPKASNIKNDQEKNNILMNIYMQIEAYDKAYTLNEQLIAKKTTAAKMAFRCNLLKLQEKDQSLLMQCYDTSAKAIKKELDNISKNDPFYVFNEFTYFLEMYRAGHIEYKDKMKNSISSMTDASMKNNASIWYEDAVSN